jgi:hypothetical protein
VCHFLIQINQLERTDALQKQRGVMRMMKEMYNGDLSYELGLEVLFLETVLVAGLVVFVVVQGIFCEHYQSLYRIQV